MKWLKTCPKSASCVCQRIFVAFGKVNNTQGGDHLQLEDEFFFDERQLLLRVDRSAKKSLDFLASGRRYMRRNVWAMAAIHLRRATSWLPDWIDGRLELAVAYIHLK